LRRRQPKRGKNRNFNGCDRNSQKATVFGLGEGPAGHRAEVIVGGGVGWGNVLKGAVTGAAIFLGVAALSGKYGEGREKSLKRLLESFLSDGRKERAKNYLAKIFVRSPKTMMQRQTGAFLFVWAQNQGTKKDRKKKKKK